MPFMDSLSFTFLAFASYTVAILLSVAAVSPGYRFANSRYLGSARVAAGLVDGRAVHGDGRYGGRSAERARRPLVSRKDYLVRPAGRHFGVPISNYLGWYFIAAVSIAIFQRLDWWLNHDGSKPLGVVPGLFCRSLLGPLLYTGIACFGITMLFVIRAPEIGFAAVFIFLPMLVLTIHILTRADSYGGEAAIARHLADFPYDNVIFKPKLVAETAAVRRRA